MSESVEVKRKRPWLAVVLAIVYPGLGHVYLRLWGRALLWFALVLFTTTILVPEGAVPTELSVDGFVQAGQAIPLEVSLTVIAITLLSVFDAYMMANRLNDQAVREHPDSDLQTCPHCGKEVDADIDFCHWCTERLDEPPE